MSARADGGAGRFKPVGWGAILAAAGTGVVLLICLGVLAWLLAGSPTSDKWFELARTVVFAFAAVGALPAGLIAFRRQRTLEIQRHDARDQLDLAKRAEERLGQEMSRRETEHEESNERVDITDLRRRYNEAAEQLGHDRAAVRLAGVHALAYLADDWADARQAQTCIDVLCSYVRTSSTLTAATAAQDAEVSRTVLRTIAEHLRPTEPEGTGPWSAYKFDLTGVNFPSGTWDLSRVVLDGGSILLRSSRLAPHGTIDFAAARIQRGGRLEMDIAMKAGSRLILAGAVVDRASTLAVSGSSMAANSRLTLGGSTLVPGSTCSFDRMRLHRKCLITFGGAVVTKGAVVTFDDVRFLGGIVTIKGASVADGTMTSNGDLFAGTDEDGQPQLTANTDE